MKAPSKKPIITVCTSASFYKQAVELEDQLEKLGLTIVLPDSARKMKADNDFERSHYQTWHTNPDDYHKKAHLMHLYFDKVAEGDAILVLNYEKHGRKNYIGANVLLEMGIAFHLGKPIFVLNDLPEDSAYEEELKGMQPILLGGKVENLPKHL